MTTAEAIVIGGGIVGASTAHYLASKGEPIRPLYEYGSPYRGLR